MFKRITSQLLVDLGDLEGDFRAFHLRDDLLQSTIALTIAGVSVLSMLMMDASLFMGSPELMMWALVFRLGFVFITVLAIIAIRKSSKVRRFDRLLLGWLGFAILSWLLFNFTRPTDHLTTAFDIIVPFAIYVLSPLKIYYTIALAWGFSAGTLYIDHFMKAGVDSLTLSMATSAQLVVQVLGLVSTLQIRSYRRKSFRAYINEKDAKEIAAYLSNIDPLTQSLTRRHFFNIAGSEFLRFARYRRPFSVLVLDADYFKNINDTYGHHAGDVVLKSLSLVVMEQKRVQDTFGRLGGEEFGILLPETNLEQACIVADRIQKMWEKTPSNMDGELIRSTVSIGVAEANPEDKSFDDVLRRADRMMYKAKEQGRNQVVAK